MFTDYKAIKHGLSLLIQSEIMYCCQKSHVGLFATSRQRQLIYTKEISIFCSILHNTFCLFKADYILTTLQATLRGLVKISQNGSCNATGEETAQAGKC